MQKLEIQLQMLPHLLRAYKIANLTITKVSSVTDMLTVVPMAKYMFSEIDKLLRLYLTIPVTTCTAERRFSYLRSMKNYLQSTMSEERLNNVMLLHVHKEETDALDVQEIASLFVSANTRRMELFGNV